MGKNEKISYDAIYINEREEVKVGQVSIEVPIKQGTNIWALFEREVKEKYGPKTRLQGYSLQPSENIKELIAKMCERNEDWDPMG